MKSIVMLRGLARNHAHWGRFPRVLSEKLELPVFTLDLPGSGERSNEDVPTSVPGLATAIHKSLATHNVPLPALVFGHSLGGMVACQLAARNPTDVAGVITINTSSADTAPILQRIQWSGVRGLIAAATAKTKEAREQAVLALTSKRTGDESLIGEWVSIAEHFPPNAMKAFKQLVAASTFRTPRVRQPVLCLASQGDRMVHFSCSVQLAKKLNAELVLHPNAGHDLVLDDPQWVLAQVEYFLRKLNGHTNKG
jgi:pimeloyl-ACP methyl ester carboxylesterase